MKPRLRSGFFLARPFLLATVWVTGWKLTGQEESIHHRINAFDLTAINGVTLAVIGHQKAVLENIICKRLGL
jgi:hypothetical protein